MKKIILKLTLAVILLMVVIGIIIFINSQYKQNISEESKVTNETKPIDKPDELIDRNMLVQITEKKKNETSTYNINLSDDGVLFKYLDTNKKTENIYDRYTIIAEKQLTYVEKKSLEQKINELESKESSNSEKIYTIIYAGEEKNVDIIELNKVLNQYGINF